MKRSEINQLVSDATAYFQHCGWFLPPKPHWDVTDFGLGDWQTFGLVLVNLADQPEYCEKLMYAKVGMATPAHCHAKKKEDIISRCGVLRIQLWADVPARSGDQPVSILLNGEPQSIPSGSFVDLHSGWRITIHPGTYHEFVPVSEECIIGEVSTANDDVNDNFFVNPRVGRYPHVEEDAIPIVKLISDSE